MGDPPPLLAASVGGGVVSDRPAPWKKVEELADRFQYKKDEGLSLSAYEFSEKGIHAFLDLLALGLDPVKWYSRIALLTVDYKGAVHLLHSFLFIPVVVYSTLQRLFASIWFLSKGGLVAVVVVKASTVRLTVCAEPRSDHVSHLGDVFSLDFIAMPCEQAANLLLVDCDLDFQGIASISLDIANQLLKAQATNIVESSHDLLPSIACRRPVFNKIINWL